MKPCAEIGLFAHHSQAMTELQRWLGQIFTHVMLSEQWFEDLASIEPTLRGNCEARIRHLKAQGWALVPFNVGCYKILASLFRMGVSSMVVTSDFSKSLSVMEHY